MSNKKYDWYEIYDGFDWSGQMNKLSINNKKFMNGIGQLSWVNIKSALIYGVLFGLFAMGDFMVSAGTVFDIDVKAFLNAGIIAGVAVVISLVKNLLTTNSGNFAGVVKVIPPTE